MTKKHHAKSRPTPRATGAPPTRRDVAAAAGVSLTTVTHALNPPPGARVNPATMERVRRAAAALGYRPSFVGRALVSGKSYAVGVLQPRLGSLFFELYQTIMVGMAAAMEADDYHLMILFRSEDFRYLKVVQQGRVDGMFVLQSDLDTSHADRVAASGIPTVIVNKSLVPPTDKPVACVHADHGRLMAEVVAEFATLGCKNILEVIDTRSIDANIRMHEGFVAATTRHATDGMVGTTLSPADHDTFRCQIRNAFSRGACWDGIVTDGAAEGDIILQEARACGRLPGRDFHLITTDIRDGATSRTREEHAAYTQQAERVGREAWRVLRDLISGTPTDTTVLVPYRRHPVTAKTDAS